MPEAVFFPEGSSAPIPKPAPGTRAAVEAIFRHAVAAVLPERPCSAM
jgi:hypothetical protein